MIKKIYINKDVKKTLYYLYFNVGILKHKNINNADKIEIDKNIKLIFKELDALKVSYKIQNIVVSLAENKKNFYNCYFIDLLNKNNIYVTN